MSKKLVLMISMVAIMLLNTKNTYSQTIVEKDTPNSLTPPDVDSIYSIDEILNRPEIFSTTALYLSTNRADAHSGMLTAIPTVLAPLPKNIDALYYKSEEEIFGTSIYIGTFIYNSRLSQTETNDLNEKIVEMMSNRKQKNKFNRKVKKGHIPTLIKNTETEKYEWDYKKDSKNTLTELKWHLNYCWVTGNFPKKEIKQQPKVQNNSYRKQRL